MATAPLAQKTWPWQCTFTCMCQLNALTCLSLSWTTPQWMTALKRSLFDHSQHLRPRWSHDHCSSVWMCSSTLDTYQQILEHRSNQKYLIRSTNKVLGSLKTEVHGKMKTWSINTGWIRGVSRSRANTVVGTLAPKTLVRSLLITSDSLVLQILLLLDVNNAIANIMRGGTFGLSKKEKKIHITVTTQSNAAKKQEKTHKSRCPQCFIRRYCKLPS